jgi:hypothetical protein
MRPWAAELPGSRVCSAPRTRAIRATDPRVAARGYTFRSGELRVDMFDAEYTHEGERCTFQTLVHRFGLRDRALTAIGEIVRDIDCKDEQFGRPETAGIASLVRGIAESHDDDVRRIERGSAAFDDLCSSSSREAAGRAPCSRKRKASVAPSLTCRPVPRRQCSHPRDSTCSPRCRS